MDFSKTNTKSSAEAGKELHLRHPVLGHRLYDGDGAGVNGLLTDAKKPHTKVAMTVRGYHAPSVVEAAKRTQRKGMETDEDQEKAGGIIIDALVVDWSGITRDGKPPPCTKENKVWLTEQNHDIFKQIDAFAKDQANFFESEPTD